VNSVGVNLNTASKYLLSRVSGIGPGLATSIVEHRGHKGIFTSRTALMEVPRFSEKTFEQAAGFLRIPESENPLDNTGVHPERYADLTATAEKLGKSIKEIMGADGVREIRAAKEVSAELREKLGEFTFDDVLKELEKPGRDPRAAFVPFSYRDDIFTVKDLQPNMICPGIVTNVTNFGAFVDIGVHQDGLVHISRLSNTFVKDPRDVVSPGDRVTVKVLEVNHEKNQISLTMKTEGAHAEKRHARGDRENAEGGKSEGGKPEGGKRGRGPRQPKKPSRPKEPPPALTVANPTLSFKPNADGSVPSISSPNRRPEPARRPEPSARGPRAPVPPNSNSVKVHPREREAREHREQFKNNPFASLAGLKSTLKR
jgi:uncharacterized protein